MTHKTDAPALPNAIASAVRNGRLEVTTHAHSWMLRCTLEACSRAWVMRYADARSAGAFSAVEEDLDAHRAAMDAFDGVQP